MFQHAYVLNEAGEPILEPDLRKWVRQFGQQENLVSLWSNGEVRVSTIFLGLDLEPGQPSLWETMVFGGELDREHDSMRWFA